MEFDSPDQRVSEPTPSQRMKAPKPTYAPFMLALGVTMIFAGLATSPVMSGGGFVVFAWALWMWIREIAQAWRD